MVKHAKWHTTFINCVNDIIAMILEEWEQISIISSFYNILYVKKSCNWFYFSLNDTLIFISNYLNYYKNDKLILFTAIVTSNYSIL